MHSRLHDDEIPIDVPLVRKMVDSQFPDYSALPLNRLRESGSTNVLFRLGDDLLVRLPRQPVGSAAIDKEQRWVTEVCHHLPVAVPEIIGLGEPEFGYGERWSIVRWIDGETPDACAPEDPPMAERMVLATDLAHVIAALRGVEVVESAASDSTLRGYRGRSLADFDKQTRRNIQKCRAIEGLDLDLDAALAVWEDALRVRGAYDVEPDRWYHGDLVAENLLLTDVRLTAVLDFGGLSVGDPTIDLHGAWEILDAPAREVFRSRLEVDDAEWSRGRAWALGIALGCFSYYWEKMPLRCRDRLAMARSVLADANER
jgi:aminoglycoside phosphotransferase (APT) family kinase protein